MIFFIESETVDLAHYTIKDIPGSSGRLDVISRCILATLLNNNRFDLETEIWVFLKKYGTFQFNPKILNYKTFPKNELLLSDYFVEIINYHGSNNELENNPLSNVRLIKDDLTTSLIKFMDNGFKSFILLEEGNDFQGQEKNINYDKVLFVIGNQTGISLNFEQFPSKDLKKISLGATSYLASSIIRLIKILKRKHLWNIL